MQKRLFRAIALLALTLQACSPPLAESTSPEVKQATNPPEIVRYTDEDVEMLIQQLPFLRTGEHGTPSPEDALEQLGIDLDALELLDHRMGDCYDGYIYDLSPSYWLLIDRNVCFGLRVWVELKDATG